MTPAIAKIIDCARTALSRKAEKLKAEEEYTEQVADVLRRYGEISDGMEKAELAYRQFEEEFDSNLVKQDGINQVAQLASQGWLNHNRWRDPFLTCCIVVFANTHREEILRKVKDETVGYAKRRMEEFLTQNRDMLKTAGVLPK